MVVFNNQALIDLEDIFKGLLGWKTKNGEFHLSADEAYEYYDDIFNVCLNIDNLSYRSKPSYNSHIKYGNCIYRYRRNKNTQWYIIYNWDKENQIAYINKIINNHLTVSGTK